MTWQSWICRDLYKGSSAMYKLTGRQMMQCAETLWTHHCPACPGVGMYMYVWYGSEGEALCVCEGEERKWLLCVCIDGRVGDRRSATVCTVQCVHALGCTSIKSHLLASIQQAAIYTLLRCSEPECCQVFPSAAAAFICWNKDLSTYRRSNGAHYSGGTEINIHIINVQSEIHEPWTWSLEIFPQTLTNTHRAQSLVLWSILRASLKMLSLRGT